MCVIYIIDNTHIQYIYTIYIYTIYIYIQYIHMIDDDISRMVMFVPLISTINCKCPWRADFPVRHVWHRRVLAFHEITIFCWWNHKLLYQKYQLWYYILYMYMICIWSVYVYGYINLYISQFLTITAIISIKQWYNCRHQNYHLVGGWPTPLNNISQLGWLSHIFWKIKHLWNHQSATICVCFFFF